VPGKIVLRVVLEPVGIESAAPPGQTRATVTTRSTLHI
jgi:hypothetical protein